MSRYFLALLVLLVPATVFAQKPPKERAKPPVFNQAEIDSTFFPDLFNGNVLVGSRPQNLSVSATPNVQTPVPNGNSPAASPSAAGRWTDIISATTIEDEVKALKLKVDADVTTPTQFASRGYKRCRKNFSTLALMFAIAGEYDGDVRWKEDAPGARDLFYRSAQNSKVGTSQAYNEAKLRKQDLQDLVGGAAFSGKEGTPAADWSQVADRSPLMQRLVSGFDDRLKPMLASQSEFKENSETVFHEAEIVAAISEALMQQGMPDGEDEDYKAFCKQMKEAARSIADAVKLDNYSQASSAAGDISKACSECHEIYRG